MDKKFFITALILSAVVLWLFTSPTFSQRPPRGGMEWFERVDANKNNTIEPEEYKSAIDEIFKKIDRNNDGVIDNSERPRQPLPRRDEFPPQGGDQRPPRPNNQMPPVPFFVMESIKEPGDVNRAEFDERVLGQFRAMDKNGDSVVTREEARSRFEEVDEMVRRDRRPEDFKPLNSPTAQFIAAETRFGDKLVKGAPFSAEIVIEDTRRLYDGSTVTKQTKGAIYRDASGRTRREQPIDSIGGFAVVGEDGSPQKLVFINDFVGKTHYFLDLNRKIARKHPLPDDRPPLEENEPKNARTESLGTKIMEGVSVEGTRTTFEIPVGQIGNDKPIAVVSEKWFSPELQVVVMSRHVDPLSGEHIFKLVSLKKSEPSPELFKVPADYQISEGDKNRENDGFRKNRKPE